VAFNTFSNEEDSPDAQAPIQKVPLQTATATYPRRGWLTGSRGLLAGIGIGIAIAAGGMTILSAKNSPAPVQSASPQPQVAGQSVAVEAVQFSSVPKTYSALGSVDAQSWAQVMPQATGLQIQSILKKDGDRVEAGEVIAVLDSSVLQDQLNEARSQLSSAQAQLSSAQAQLGSAQAQVESARSGVRQKQALLSQQKAVLAEAESNLQRYQNLRKQGVVSQQDLESRSTSALSARESVSVARSNISSAESDVVKAQAGVNQAQAGVSQAQAGIQSAVTRIQQLETKIAQTNVRAAASGILTEKNPSNTKEVVVAKVGELTGTNPLFYIERDGSLELQVTVPENILAQVRVGSPVKVTSDADSRIQVQGRVREINPVVNQQTRQATVKIDLPESGLFKPGQALKANITIQKTQALTVSDKAIAIQPDGRKTVYVVDRDAVAHEKTVETGDISQGRVVIQSGLQQGDRVVAMGAGFVKDGDLVTIAP
jgi:RND family efflux transporter MFP subunit